MCYPARGAACSSSERAIPDANVLDTGGVSEVTTECSSEGMPLSELTPEQQAELAIVRVVAESLRRRMPDLDDFTLGRVVFNLADLLNGVAVVLSTGVRPPGAPAAEQSKGNPWTEGWLARPDSYGPEVSERLTEQVATVVQELRLRGEMLKPPGVAETLDWAKALHQLGRRDLDLESAAATIGAVCKYREDTERVRVALDKMLTV